MNDKNALKSSAARNLADCHEASLKPLGIECRRGNGLWWQRNRLGPVIYVAAVTLSPSEDAPRQREELEALTIHHGNATFAIIDSWNEPNLADLGFLTVGTGPWYIRQPGPPTAKASPPELSIEEVTDVATLLEFETASWDGFESGDAPRSAGPGGQQTALALWTTHVCTIS